MLNFQNILIINQSYFNNINVDYESSFLKLIYNNSIFLINLNFLNIINNNDLLLLKLNQLNKVYILENKFVLNDKYFQFASSQY